MVGSGLSMGRTMKVIVTGARGCGKTSILEKVIYDNNGVSHQCQCGPFAISHFLSTYMKQATQHLSPT